MSDHTIKVINSSNMEEDDSISQYKEQREVIRVLIVDDDKSSGEALKTIIGYRGHEVTLLDEGMKFVNRMNEEEFDIIFMDYHTNEFSEDHKNEVMGNDNEIRNIHILADSNEYSESDSIHGEDDYDEDVTGTYVTKLAKECYDFDTPVFAYTGDDSVEAQDDFKESGFKGALIKPINMTLINDFFEILEKELEKNNSLVGIDINSRTKLRKLAMKNKNFIFFKKKRTIV